MIQKKKKKSRQGSLSPETSALDRQDRTTWNKVPGSGGCVSEARRKLLPVSGDPSWGKPTCAMTTWSATHLLKDLLQRMPG